MSAYVPYALEDVRPKFMLTGKRFIITGGAGGIGFATARAICEMGGNVAILDIQDTPAEEYSMLASKYGVKTTYIKTDVTKEASLNSSFEAAFEFLGGVDGLVPCAGIAIDKPFIEQSWDEMSRIQDINVRGSFFAAQLVAKRMIAQGTGGSIVLIASHCAHVAIPGYRMAAYNASKGAIKTLSIALAVELGPYNIRVNTVSPGFIDSEMTKVVRDAKTNPKEAEAMYTAAPIKRIGTQNDLTGAMVYLLSDASTFATATDIIVTGGIHAGRIECD